MGWNTLEREPGSRLLAGLPDPAWCYFVHTFAPEPDRRRRRRRVVRLRPPVRGRGRAGPLWATQFHPEKSGAVGLALLGNFVTAVAA